MNPAEKAAVQDFAKHFVDVDFPMLVAAEEAKLPAAYAAIAKLVSDAMLPQIQAVMDAKIAAL